MTEEYIIRMTITNRLRSCTEADPGKGAADHEQ